MSGQINQYPIEATEIEDDDYLDIDKYLGEVPIGVNPYESQKIKGANLNYDSGEKYLAWHKDNGVFGLAFTGFDVYKPKMRIQNRTVRINGTLVLPLEKSPGVLDTSGDGYPEEAFEGLFQSAIEGGWDVTTQGNCITSDPIIPANLTPQSTVILDFGVFPTRTVKMGFGLKTRLQSFISAFGILANGELFMSPIRANELDGSTSDSAKNSAHLMRKITSKFDNGDQVPIFDSYRNSFDNVGADKMIRTSSASQTCDFTHDATRGEGLGAYVINMNYEYEIDSNTTIAQIRSAFDSM